MAGNHQDLGWTTEEPSPALRERNIHQMAIGQNPNRLAPSEHPIQSNHQNRKPKMSGEFTYPKMVPLVLTHSQMVNPNPNPKPDPAVNGQDISLKTGKTWCYLPKGLPL